MNAKQKVVQISGAIFALAIGVIIYLNDPQSTSVYFVSDWLSLAKNSEPVFGKLGNHRPTFLHVIAMGGSNLFPHYPVKAIWV